MVRRAPDKDPINYQTWLFVAWDLDWHVKCEGDGDVVGVLTPLRGGAQVVLHGAHFFELRVLLGVHQEGEVEEDGEGHVEVKREEGEV